MNVSVKALAIAYMFYGCMTHPMKENELHALVQDRSYKWDENKILIAEKLIKSGINVNALYLVLNGINWWRDYNSQSCHGVYEATALGLALFYDQFYCQSALADMLVGQGACLAGSYGKRFGFYFAKKMDRVGMESYDNATSYCKLFETLLYRRIQRCCKESMTIYLITNRIKKKTLYASLASTIPKPLVDLIACLIIKEGIQDVQTVLSETTKNHYKASRYKYPHEELSSRDRTYLTLFQMLDHKVKKGGSINNLDLRPFNPEAWEKDFNEFIRNKRDIPWRKDNRGNNLILRSLHYTRNSRYSDKELAIEGYLYS